MVRNMNDFTRKLKRGRSGASYLTRSARIFFNRDVDRSAPQATLNNLASERHLDEGAGPLLVQHDRLVVLGAHVVRAHHGLATPRVDHQTVLHRRGSLASVEQHPHPVGANVARTNRRRRPRNGRRRRRDDRTTHRVTCRRVETTAGRNEQTVRQQAPVILGGAESKLVCARREVERVGRRTVLVVIAAGDGSRLAVCHLAVGRNHVGGLLAVPATDPDLGPSVEPVGRVIRVGVGELHAGALVDRVASDDLGRHRVGRLDTRRVGFGTERHGEGLVGVGPSPSHNIDRRRAAGGLPRSLPDDLTVVVVVGLVIGRDVEPVLSSTTDVAGYGRRRIPVRGVGRGSHPQTREQQNHGHQQHPQSVESRHRCLLSARDFTPGYRCG